jgi:hypothetical protein
VDLAFDNFVHAVTDAKVGVGIRISSTLPVTCTATLEGQSASRHPLSARFVGSSIISVDGVPVAARTPDQVRALVLGPFGSVCSLQLQDEHGVVFSAAVLRAEEAFFTSYEEQVLRIGAMMPAAPSAALQAQNAALQQKVALLHAHHRSCKEQRAAA